MQPKQFARVLVKISWPQKIKPQVLILASENTTQCEYPIFCCRRDKFMSVFYKDLHCLIPKLIVLGINFNCTPNLPSLGCICEPLTLSNTLPINNNRVSGPASYCGFGSMYLLFEPVVQPE